MTELQTAARAALDMLEELERGHWSPLEAERVRVMLRLAMRDVERERDAVLSAYMMGVNEGRRQAG